MAADGKALTEDMVLVEEEDVIVAVAVAFDIVAVAVVKKLRDDGFLKDADKFDVF